MERSRASSSAPARSSRDPRGRRVAIVGLGALTLALALSHAGAWWWVLDLLAHFHAIYLLLAMLVAIGLAALRWRRLALWAVGLVVWQAALVLPLYSFSTTTPDPSRPRLRVVSYNMLYGNPQLASAARHILALEPDVVVLLETSAAQLEIFTAALPGWHAVSRPRADPFGIAVLTREAPIRATVIEPGPAWMPAIELELELGGRPVALMAVHPPPPVSAANTRTRDELLRHVSRWAAAHEGPTLVMGDLNATPWSSALAEILDEGPLRSTQSFGLQGTWPASLGGLALPIDHALYSGSLHPVARTIEPAFGSDHRMLFVELELR